MNRRRRATVAVLSCALLALPVAGTPAQAAVPKTTPFALLKQLVVTPETTTTAPKASAAWSKPTVKKCRTLQVQVLAADAAGVTPKSCSTAGLSWTDPLTGTTVKDAAKMTVVRLVPIEEAWDSGASLWDAKTRTAFANDLGYDGSLVAVSKTGANKRKDREPSAWTPAQKLQCAYATTWMTVKLRWNLTVDRAEYDALRHIMGVAKCDKRQVPAVKLAGAPAPVLPVPPAPGPTRYETCETAEAAHQGPFVRGRDVEYSWYRDDDGDGIACELIEAIELVPSSDWRTERVTSFVDYLAVVADLVPGAGDHVNARILRDGTELWRGSGAPQVQDPTWAFVQVPAGVVTTEGNYVVQTWTGAADEATPAADALSMTFRVDLTAPDYPTIEYAPPPGGGMVSIPTAYSDAPDVAALWFSGPNGAVRVAVKPGERVVAAPPGSAGGVLVYVRAEDHAGNVSQAAVYSAPA